MNVLLISGEYPPGQGGVGDYTALLAGHLARAGARVAVLTRGDEQPAASALGAGEPRVLRMSGGWGVASWPRVAGAAATWKAEIVHLQYQAAAFAMSPAVNLLPAYLRARLPRVRVATTFHDLRVPYLFPKAGPLRRGALRALDSLSHATVATNRADLEALGGGGRAKPGGGPRRRLIPLGSNVEVSPPADFDRRVWRSQLGAGPDTLVLAYFGFMNDSKGVESLVQALGLLAARGLDARLLVVGGETGETDPTNRIYSHRVHQLITARRLEERVFWTGFLPPAQVSADLLSSDVCALPFRDGASLRRGSLLAALAHGLPVVTTTPEHPEPFLLDGENVVMARPDSPADLAEAIQRLWRDPNARSRLSEGARTLAARFRWPDIARRHLEMYEQLLSDV